MQPHTLTLSGQARHLRDHVPRRESSDDGLDLGVACFSHVVVHRRSGYRAGLLGVGRFGECGGERVDDGGVELGAGTVMELCDGVHERHRQLVRAVARHRVVCVDDGDDARADRDLVAPEPVGVAAAVHPFVGRSDDRCDALECWCGGDDSFADLAVALHVAAFPGVERSGLVEDRVGDRCLPDVVELGRARDIETTQRLIVTLSGQVPSGAWLFREEGYVAKGRFSWAYGGFARDLPNLAHAESYCLDSGLGARPRTEFAQDRRHMAVDGAFRQKQRFGDLGIASALREEREHLELAPRQPGWILYRRHPRPPRQLASSVLAKAAGNHRGGLASTETLQLAQRLQKRIVVVTVG